MGLVLSLVGLRRRCVPPLTSKRINAVLVSSRLLNSAGIHSQSYISVIGYRDRALLTVSKRLNPAD